MMTLKLSHMMCDVNRDAGSIGPRARASDAAAATLTGCRA
jgi:hypothetical protein